MEEITKQELTKLDKFINWLIPVLMLILKAGLILLIGHIIIKIIIRFVKKSFARTNLDLSLQNFIKKTINISLHIVVFLSALNALGISTTGLLAALSAAAVGIALALKDSLSSVAAGILLLVSPRFKTGDLVEIGGEIGYILQIDLIHTSLLTFDNRHIIVPNNNIINSEIVNFTTEEKRRVDITFSIGYDDDADFAMKLIIETAMNIPSIYKDPLPFARIDNYAESSVDIISRCWCKSEDYFDVRFDILENVRKAFNQNGITIPFNQLDVHISSEDAKKIIQKN